MIHKYLSKQNYELIDLSTVIDEIERNIENQEAHIKLAHMTFVDLLESYQHATMTTTMYIGDFKRLWYSLMSDLVTEMSTEQLPLSDRFMNIPNRVWVN